MKSLVFSLIAVLGALVSDEAKASGKFVYYDTNWGDMALSPNGMQYVAWTQNYNTIQVCGVNTIPGKRDVRCAEQRGSFALYNIGFNTYDDMFGTGTDSGRGRAVHVGMSYYGGYAVANDQGQFWIGMPYGTVTLETEGDGEPISWSLYGNLPSNGCVLELAAGNTSTGDQMFALGCNHNVYLPDGAGGFTATHVEGNAAMVQISYSTSYGLMRGMDTNGQMYSYTENGCGVPGWDWCWGRDFMTPIQNYSLASGHRYYGCGNGNTQPCTMAIGGIFIADWKDPYITDAGFSNQVSIWSFDGYPYSAQFGPSQSWTALTGYQYWGVANNQVDGQEPLPVQGPQGPWIVQMLEGAVGPVHLNTGTNVGDLFWIHTDVQRIYSYEVDDAQPWPRE
jgi:hypothetical protein